MKCMNSAWLCCLCSVVNVSHRQFPKCMFTVTKCSRFPQLKVLTHAFACWRSRFSWSADSRVESPASPRPPEFSAPVRDRVAHGAAAGAPTKGHVSATKRATPYSSKPRGPSPVKSELNRGAALVNSKVDEPRWASPPLFPSPLPSLPLLSSLPSSLLPSPPSPSFPLSHLPPPFPTPLRRGIFRPPQQPDPLCLNVQRISRARWILLDYFPRALTKYRIMSYDIGNFTKEMVGGRDLGQQDSYEQTLGLRPPSNCCDSWW